LLQKLPDAVKPAKKRRLVDLARPQLIELLKELDEAASKDLSRYEALHPVRIAGKRLRYATEVFESCLPSSFRERDYPRIEQLQEILGLVNDSHVAGIWLENLRDRLKPRDREAWRRWRPGIEAMIRFHARRVAEQRREFTRWWREWEKVKPAFALAITGSAEEAEEAE